MVARNVYSWVMSKPFLTQQQQKSFHQDGYIILPNFKSSAEILEIKKQAQRIVSSHDLDRHRAVFATGEQKEECQDVFQQYYLDSANQISCFFEEKAFNSNGELTQPLEQSINKIGHAVHDLDPVFKVFSHGEKLAALAQNLGLTQPQIWQSMYIFKQAKIGGKVDWHQDASFFRTDPNSVITFWFALDDATLENGCLWIEKGGHKSPLRQVFIRQGDITQLHTVNDMPWPDMDSAEPVEVKAGTLVCFHGHLPHYSAENTSDKARHAYTLHVTDGAAKYARDNWIQRDNDFPVCGFSTKRVDG